MILTLYGGMKVHPPDIPDEALDIHVIAHALALINRFGGHSKFPISVAQHSVWAADHCSRNARLAALLHDASEAYLGDIPSPWKRATGLFADYLTFEATLQQRIYERFGCRGDMYGVDQADHLALEVEMISSYDEPHWFIENPSAEARWLARRYESMHWRQAEDLFLVRFKELTSAPR